MSNHWHSNQTQVYGPFRDVTRDGLMRIASARRQRTDDKKFLITLRVQQAAGSRRIDPFSVLFVKARKHEGNSVLVWNFIQLGIVFGQAFLQLRQSTLPRCAPSHRKVSTGRCCTGWPHLRSWVPQGRTALSKVCRCSQKPRCPGVLFVR